MSRQGHKQQTQARALRGSDRGKGKARRQRRTTLRGPDTDAGTMHATKTKDSAREAKMPKTCTLQARRR
eukprot:8601173-Alexandrium_andersonii.AAC.1